MPLTRFTVRLGILCTFCAVVGQSASVSVPKPPDTRRDNVMETMHGVAISDPYRWLEDQESPETRKWIKQQNDYTHGLLDARPGRDRLQSRFAELRKVTSIRLPIERNGRYIYSKRLPDQDQFVIYKRDGADSKEEVLIDPNPMSEDHSINVEPISLSSDGKILLYQLRHGGKDETEIHAFDIDRRQNLPDVLPEALYFDASMLPDHSGLYYSMMVPEGPRLRFHKMGDDSKQDVDVFGKGYAKDKAVIGEVTEDGRYLVIQVWYGSSGDQIEVWSQDLAAHSELKPLVKDIKARFLPFPGGNKLYLQTNWKASRGRVLMADFDDSDPSKWREVIPEAEDAIEAWQSPAASSSSATYIMHLPL
ncbi:MAG TPA: hypothetical protein VFU50_16595 [Terriglobales bacterium]|nr:hypothetical protein [Terriglobales bacterium]